MMGSPDLVADIVTDVDEVFLFSPGQSLYDSFQAADEQPVVVAPANDVGAESFVELPLSFQDVRDRIRFGVEGAMNAGLATVGDTVLAVLGVFTDGPDATVRVTVTESMQSGIYDLFVNSRAESSVIRDVGALFVVGDAGKTMNNSRPLSYNPFEKSHVHVGDPIVDVMLKEFSRLDGAFVISDSGKIVSSYRYLEPSAEGVDIPKGLGARHMAAAAITRDTNAVAIVLSESDGLVRAFKSGELILKLDPEEY
jgi:DNA integrity scanning protein DisA with diadenylate cyclase activity